MSDIPEPTRVDPSLVREIVEAAGDESFSDLPECPDCGRPMMGHETDSGPWCAWCDVEEEDNAE